MNKSSFPYQVIEEYVRGGCSVIFKVRARHEGSQDEHYVLKTMSINDDEPENRKRFYMEYEFLRAYPHPNLVEVREYFSDWHGRPAYVMEWVKGSTWQTYWRGKRVLEQWPTYLSHVRQLCEVLDYIHKHNIIHRDLKPQNVLIARDGTVKVIDFGIMKVADLVTYRQNNTLMGSAFYVAPEALAGEQVTYRVDIFALGVMLYDQITGVKPFQGQTLGETIYQRLVKAPRPPSAIVDVPKELDDVILRMLNRDPHKRQRNCAEIVASLEAILGDHVVTAVASSTNKLDVLTKRPFLHTHFLENCQKSLSEKQLLYVLGEPGCGKTTVVENLCTRMFGDDWLKMDCRPNSNWLDFLEAILQQLTVPSSLNQELAPWREILGRALPSLQWPAPEMEQTLNFPAIMSAFKQLFHKAKNSVIVLFEDVQDAPPSVVQFLEQLIRYVGQKGTVEHYVVITAKRPVPAFGSLSVRKVPFPDIITLTDYLTHIFGKEIRVPLELTQELVKIAGENLGAFVNMVEEYKALNRLKVVDGFLKLSGPGNVKKVAEAKGEKPAVLREFNAKQLAHLEWLALSPEEIGINILARVTGSSVNSLGITVNHASELKVLAFRSGGVEGFRWLNEDVRRYLVDHLDAKETVQRNLQLAEALEKETARFLAHAPPLWLVLSRLYRRGEYDTKAAEFAFRYARYCFQNANYEAIRNSLSQFIALPQFQDNVEYWCMMAMAHADTDLSQALYFGKRALSVEENTQVKVLMAVLEFRSFHEIESREFINAIFENNDLAKLEINYASQLMPILIQLNMRNELTALYAAIHKKMDGRSDPFASNVLLQMRLQLVLSKPKRLVEMVAEAEGEILPETRRKMFTWGSYGYQMLNRFEDALVMVRKLGAESRTDVHYLRELIYLYLNFGHTQELRTLIAFIKDAEESSDTLAKLTPLIQLVTEILVKDPNLFKFDSLKQRLQQADVDVSGWLTLIVSVVEPRFVKAAFLEATLDYVSVAAWPWVRHQIPRLKILTAVKQDRQQDLKLLFEQAQTSAELAGVALEKQRLKHIRDYVVGLGYAI